MIAVNWPDYTIRPLEPEKPFPNQAIARPGLERTPDHSRFRRITDNTVPAHQGNPWIHDASRHWNRIETTHL